MLGPARLRNGLVIDEAELSWRFSRSGGPGGQGVNTTDSRAELSWDAARTTALPPVLHSRLMAALEPRLVDGVLTIAASEHRSQLRNREAAVGRLVALLDDALRPPAQRHPTRPSRASRGRRTAAERHRREIKASRRRPRPGD